MIKLKVTGPRTSKSIYALLDEGSTISIINKRIVDIIGIQGTNVNISLRGIGQKEPIACSNKKINISIESSSYCGDLHNVLVVKDLPLPTQCLSSEISTVCEKETGVRVLPFKDSADLLLGQDYCQLIICREFREIYRVLLLFHAAYWDGRFMVL